MKFLIQFNVGGIDFGKYVDNLEILKEMDIKDYIVTRVE